MKIAPVPSLICKHNLLKNNQKNADNMKMTANESSSNNSEFFVIGYQIVNANNAPDIEKVKLKASSQYLIRANLMKLEKKLEFLIINAIPNKKITDALYMIQRPKEKKLPIAVHPNNWILLNGMASIAANIKTKINNGNAAVTPSFIASLILNFENFVISSST